MNVRDRANLGVERQYRSFDLSDYEFRDADGDTGWTFEGVASVVDTSYTVRDRWGEFTETIASGGFNKTLRDSKADVCLFVNHDYRGLPLATRLSDSLALAADPNLRVTATKLDPERPSVIEARSAVRGGQARQMSIGFTVPKARDEWNDDMTERVIHEVKLHEVSIVWQGANPHTTASMRSLSELIDTFTDPDELDETELRRAIAHLESLLAVPAPEQIERSGLVVSDRLLALWELRRTA
jgi:HK97 family phage prohead protease